MAFDWNKGTIATPTTGKFDFSKGSPVKVNQLDGFSILDQQKKLLGSEKLGSFATGVGKGILSTVKGVATIGQDIAQQTAGRALEALTGKPKESFGAPVLEKGTEQEQRVKEILTPQGTAENIGYGGEKIAEFAVPGAKIRSATESLPFLSKLLVRGTGAGTIATAQEGKIGTSTAIAGGTEIALPIAGKIISPILTAGKRLVQSLASGLSGVSSKTIDAIVSEPQVSKNIIKNINVEGTTPVLKKNAETILNGVSKVRQEARVAFGQAVQALKSEDINPITFRQSIGSFLDSVGSKVQSNGVRNLSNVEFSDTKNIKIANKLINDLSKTNLDGYSLRTLLNKIDNSAYKIATSDERLSFNAFIHGLSDSVKNAITNSTDKLNEINKAYSTDLQLTNAIEGIFGKVKFKSLNELRTVSEKLDTLFAKRGLSPDIIDSFLNRIGVKPSEFKATEAVRQISDIGFKSNTEGLSFGEVMRAVTSSIITPKAIRNASVLTGIAEQNLAPILESLNPTARGAFIELLLNFKNNAGDTTVNPPQQ